MNGIKHSELDIIDFSIYIQCLMYCLILLMSSSKNQFYSQIIKGSELLFMIGNSIDYSEFKNQRDIFEFLDQLLI